MDHTEILGHYARPEPPADNRQWQLQANRQWQLQANRQRSFEPGGCVGGGFAAPAVSCLQTSGCGAVAGRFFAKCGIFKKNCKNSPKFPLTH